MKNTYIFEMRAASSLLPAKPSLDLSDPRFRPITANTLPLHLMILSIR